MWVREKDEEWPRNSAEPASGPCGYSGMAGTPPQRADPSTPAGATLVLPRTALEYLPLPLLIFEPTLRLNFVSRLGPCFVWLSLVLLFRHYPVTSIPKRRPTVGSFHQLHHTSLGITSRLRTVQWLITVYTDKGSG